jgi:hypothetical protein
MIKPNMTDVDAFMEFCIDHIKTFNAVPCEFETKSGDVWDSETCFSMARICDLLDLIKDEEP